MRRKPLRCWLRNNIYRLITRLFGYPPPFTATLTGAAAATPTVLPWVACIGGAIATRGVCNKGLHELSNCRIADFSSSIRAGMTSVVLQVSQHLPLLTGQPSLPGCRFGSGARQIEHRLPMVQPLS
jgi:hypothetical protein